MSLGIHFARHSFCFSIAGAVLLISCKPKIEEGPNAQRKPNIVLIVADDLGWGDVGFNGQEHIQTPVLDRLAGQGLVLSQMYAGSTVCGPSRATLMTGLHTGHGRVRGNPKWSLSGKPVDFDPNRETLAEMLKSAGYRTGIVGKWGLAENLSETVPNKQGFDYFFGFNRHLPAHHYYPREIWENDSLVVLPNRTREKTGEHIQETFTNKALDFISVEDERPFFLYLAYTTPHFELTIPDQYKAQYDSLGWPLREMSPGHYYHDRNGHVTYASMVSKMDFDIGRLVNELSYKGQLENTLVIFTSDNGHEYDQLTKEFFDSNGPFRGRKRDLYEGGIRVPFLAYWPTQIRSGRRSDHPVAFWDIKETIRELTGVEKVQAEDGVSFLPTLLNEEVQQQSRVFYWEFNERQGPVQSVLVGDWKLVHFVEEGRYELYDIKRDPSETVDQKTSNPQKVAELLEAMHNERSWSAEFPLTRRPDPWR